MAVQKGSSFLLKDNSGGSAVTIGGLRSTSMTINGEMVWRNEKVYNNFQVQEVISELEYVVFVVYKAGVYKVELSA